MGLSPLTPTLPSVTGHTGLSRFPDRECWKNSPGAPSLLFNSCLFQMREYAIFAHPLQANFLPFCSPVLH